MGSPECPYCIQWFTNRTLGHTFHPSAYPGNHRFQFPRDWVNVTKFVYRVNGLILGKP